MVVVRQGNADRGVDPHDFAVQIEERAAGITADERAVGGEEITRTFRNDAAEANGRRAGGVEARRVAEREHPVTRDEGLGCAHGGEGPRTLALDLDHRDILGIICAKDLAADLLAIREHDLQLFRTLDDVRSRQDETVRGGDHAGAGRAGFFREQRHGGG